MAELEEQSGTISPSEEPTPHHGRGVDPSSITVNPVEQSAITSNSDGSEKKPGAFFTSMQESLKNRDVKVSDGRVYRSTSSSRIVRGM